MSLLFERMYGCLAATRVASAMGACPEGRPVSEIREKYGIVDEFYPYHHYQGVSDWIHPAGSTEDGIERQKLMCTAIIEKGDRITADDLVATWVRICDPAKMLHMTEQFDRDLLAVAKSGIVKAGDLGNLCAKYSHLNTTIRSFHAICMINAGDIPSMIQDLYDVGRVYQPLSSDAFPFGVAYNAAVVHAMRPEATVESVVDTALSYATPQVRAQFERDLGIARRYDEPLDMVDEIHQNYNAKDALYDQSRAHETASKAIAIFAAAKGDVRKCTVTSVNFGRDTDCLAAAAAGLAGALRGIENVPSEWVAKVDEVTRDHPYTNSQLTMEETAEGIMRAFKNKTERMRNYVSFADSNS